MGVGCTRNVQASVEVHRAPPGSAGRDDRQRAATASTEPGGAPPDEALPAFFSEILGELERHRRQLGGLKNFQERPHIERKATRKELASNHSDYEYIYLTVLGLARLHLRNEEIVRRNNGLAFNKNPGVQMLERVTGLTMHAEREGSTHMLRMAPASLIEAFQMSKADPGGPIKFFKTAFDRTADPCLEGRVGRLMEYIEARRRSADPATRHAPPWEDVALRTLPEGATPQDIIGEHLRVFVGECTWRWAEERGLSYEDAVEARQRDEHQEDFPRLFNAGTFEALMLARGVATADSSSGRRQWESATKSGEWIPYEPDVSLLIQQAHAKGIESTSIRLGPKSWLYQIDFTKMVQRNPKTGQERILRCVEAAEGAPGCRPLSREALADAVRFFVELETLPPAPGAPPSSTQPAVTTNPESAPSPAGTTNPGSAQPLAGTTNPGSASCPAGIANPGSVPSPSGTTNPGSALSPASIESDLPASPCEEEEPAPCQEQEPTPASIESHLPASPCQEEEPAPCQEQEPTPASIESHLPALPCQEEEPVPCQEQEPSPASIESHLPASPCQEEEPAPCQEQEPSPACFESHLPASPCQEEEPAPCQEQEATSKAT